MGIQVYGFWRSIASFRVRVALKLKGLPFEEISIDILSGEQFKPGYAAINVERVVPTFIHDGHSIFQSLAIIEYLDDIQPEPRLVPADPKERAYARALAMVTVADAHPLVTPASATISPRPLAPTQKPSINGAGTGPPRDWRPMSGC
jgi:maleylacetoacetate isomerase